jgi:hypothetical protein
MKKDIVQLTEQSPSQGIVENLTKKDQIFFISSTVIIGALVLIAVAYLSQRLNRLEKVKARQEGQDNPKLKQKPKPKPKKKNKRGHDRS